MKEKINTEGLILTNWVAGDKDTSVYVLTRDRGVVQCFVKGTANMKNSNFSAVQSLSYSKITIYCGSRNKYIDEARILKTFFEANTDMETTALIQYFCELIIKTVPENTASSDQLDLMLNTLHLLLMKKKPLLFVKTVFEIRLASVSGHQPNLIYCDKCGKYEAREMFFDYIQNKLICCDCCSGGEYLCPLSAGALTAFRYVTFAEPKKIFSFQVAEDSLKQLAACTEKYALGLCDSRLYTLDYYYNVKEMNDLIKQ